MGRATNKLLIMCMKFQGICSKCTCGKKRFLEDILEAVAFRLIPSGRTDEANDRVRANNQAGGPA